MIVAQVQEEPNLTSHVYANFQVKSGSMQQISQFASSIHHPEITNLLAGFRFNLTDLSLRNVSSNFWSVFVFPGRVLWEVKQEFFMWLPFRAFSRAEGPNSASAAPLLYLGIPAHGGTTF